MATITADAGKHVQFRPGSDLGGFPGGDEGRGCVILLDGGFDGVFLVIVLNFSILNGRRPVVQNSQTRCAEGLAFAALLKRTDGGTQAWTAEYVREGVLNSDPDIAHIRIGDNAGVVHGKGGRLRGSTGLPQCSEAQESRLGDGDEARLDEDLLYRPVEFFDNLLDHKQLFGCAFRNDQIVLIVERELAQKQVLDDFLNHGHGWCFIIDEALDLRGLCCG